MDNQILENSITQLKKELRTTRIFCIVSSVLTVLVLVGGIYVFCKLQPALKVVEQTGPIIQEMEKLDMASVNTTLEQVNTALEKMDWEKVSEAVEDLDTEELSKGIERLNKVIDVLEGVGEKFSSLKGFFGN